MEGVAGKKMPIYGAVLFVLLLAALYVYFIQPLNARANELERQLAAKKQEFAAYQAKSNPLAQRSDADVVKLEAMRKEVPEQAYTEAILRDLRRLEVVSGVQMKMYDIVPGTAAVQGGAMPIKINTSFTGNYAQISSLVKEMESLDRLMQVDSMSLRLTQGPLVQINSPGEPITSNMTFIAYYSPALRDLIAISNTVEYENPSGRTNPFH
ncbi:type 4a pilus biogenesis protein PilO [Paenibacillus cymbidii]|uniref:type 4a pilus biogenesis protein PilO n=1 Tax=Paenibacillus cymbidii TaxID=1639034 RepID=UPI0014368B0E|nr:type 4a pilus biogenesis protein PilO [Paenibacillus cymbidii]